MFKCRVLFFLSQKHVSSNITIIHMIACVCDVKHGCAFVCDHVGIGCEVKCNDVSTFKQ